MQYSPRLKDAMEQIKRIIKGADIAAVVVLHTPGFSEYFYEISPSYSCASFQGNEIRVRAKLVEDFKGNKEAWTLMVTNTSNMLNLLARTTGQVCMNLSQISKVVDAKVQADHTDGGHTGHNQQNN